MELKICIFCEELTPYPNEGIRKFAFCLMKEMLKENRVLGLCNRGTQSLEHSIKYIPAGRLLLDRALMRELRQFGPDIVFYIPTACGTILSFLRARILKFYARGARAAMILLQPRRHSFLFKLFAPRLLPDIVFTQSLATTKTISSLGVPAKTISSGVDLARFCPVKKHIKRRLRQKYDLPASDRIILHVGHINANRNVRILKAFWQWKGTQTVMVGGTNTFQDQDLAKELEHAGVRVFTDYIQNIEEMYQLADCYLFPVFSDSASIQVPLSVLEAMACNLPVVSTRFAGSSIFDGMDEKKGFFWVNNEEEIYSRIDAAQQITAPKTREMANSFSWEHVVDQLLREVAEL